MAGPDDLLLLLTQLWARDRSAFPTEDDRHDVATIMLFQAYTGGRPAEFVHVSKGKASQDPLGEAEANKNERPRRGDEDNGVEYNDDSDAGNGPNYDDDIDCAGHADNGEEDAEDDAVAHSDLFRRGAVENADQDSGYNSDETDTLIREGSDNCSAVGTDGPGEPRPQDCDAADLDEFGEAIRKYKALCYEDICLWIVRNPRKGERDVLAMEVHLRHYKGVDNKPKPYAAPRRLPKLS